MLGAILVNNEAFYRVSDFLEPEHFYEGLHRQIYETAAQLIRVGKVATPITLKTFLPADEQVGEITVSQYLVRLATQATTIINAVDYGRSIYDLAIRRSLIGRMPKNGCMNWPNKAATMAASTALPMP